VIQPANSEVSGAHGPTRQELKGEAIEFVKMIVWFLILFAILRGCVMEGYEVEGDSMLPTLADRERILVFKLPHNLSRINLFSEIKALEEGDIVVFNGKESALEKRYLKRVIARGPTKRHNTVEAKQHADGDLPNDAVLVEFDRGVVYVNNRRIQEDYLPSMDYAPDEHDAVELGPGQYYVMGDNRPVSKDSRSFGPVEDDALIGRAVFRFWPPSRIGLLK